MECGGSATAQIFGTTGGRTGTKAHQHHVWQIRRLEDLPDFRWMHLGDSTSLMPPRPHVDSFTFGLCAQLHRKFEIPIPKQRVPYLGIGR